MPIHELDQQRQPGRSDASPPRIRPDVEVGPEEMLVGLVARGTGLARGTGEPAHEAPILYDLVAVLGVKRAVALEQPFFHVIRANRIVGP
jgi:hypothetical protein